jgi:hypothetical protein
MLIAQGASLLDFYVVGNVSCKSSPCNQHVIPVPKVQRALLDVAYSPRTGAYLDQSLAGSGVELQSLEKLKLIRKIQQQYVIDFPLLTAPDLKRVRNVSVRYARLLADQLLARRDKIESTLASYDAPGVDRKDVAFVVLGCFSLDWDGMKVSLERGLMSTPAVRPDGRYSPQGEEHIPGSRAREYSRSSSRWQSGLPMTVFGDGSGRGVLQDLAPHWREAHAAMLSLRESPSSGAPMPVLLKLGFVREADGHQAAVPVLSNRDRKMVRELLRIGRESLNVWFDMHFRDLRFELAGMAPDRAGVPFSETFAAVWHYIFGQANAMLVENGLFAPPRQGFTPVVFVPGLLSGP